MNKKTIKFIFSLLFILLLLLLAFLIFTFYKFHINKIRFENSVLEISEKNKRPIFAINNITFFSSCNADTDSKLNSNFTLKNLYQYTDIAIFINNTISNNEITLENTLKEVSINNINIFKNPDLGNPVLYYKSLNQFAKANFNEENKLDKELNFSITSENSIDYDSPTLYNNCANPITLSYVNNNIKTNYSINTSSPITYDGSLLKRSNILLKSISCNISFDIFITNNLNQKFKCPINIDIPLESDSNSIYKGSLIAKKTSNFVFYRYQ